MLLSTLQIGPGLMVSTIILKNASNGNAATDPHLKANISGNTLSTVESVTYLGVTFWNNAKWSTHFEDIFRKCVRLSIFVKKLRRLSTPTAFIRKFVEAWVLPLIPYCSPAIFPGLLKHGFALFKRSIILISQVCGLSFSYLTNLVCERHIKASSDFEVRIPGDHQLSLHDDLSKTRSHTSTRSRFKHNALSGQTSNKAFSMCLCLGIVFPPTA